MMPDAIEIPKPRPRISKREAELKAAFTKELHERLPGYLQLLQATAGAPDRAIVGGGKTTWWEFKHGTPDFDSPGNQELMCMRLDHVGFCRYVIWRESKGIRRTLIVTPSMVHNQTAFGLVPEFSTDGFDHRWLCEQIQRIHSL